MGSTSPTTDSSKVSIRSYNTSASKSADSPALSAKKFRLVISGIQKVKDEFLASSKAQALSQAKNYKDLKASLVDLSTEICTLRSENASLKNVLATLKGSPCSSI